MKAFFVDLYERVIKSYKSTLLGLLIAFIGEAISYGTANFTNPYVHSALGIVALVFAMMKSKAIADGTAKMLILFVAIGLSLSACSFIQREFGSTIAADELACVKDVPPDVLAKVENALATDGADYVAVIEQAGIGVGKDLATCAVNAAIADFKAAHAAEAADAGATAGPDAHTVAIARAQAALQMLQAPDAGK